MSYPISVVPFHGDSVMTINVDGTQYVAIRPICQALGIDRKRQQQKITSEERWGHMTPPCQTPGGVQEMLCIPLRKLNGWLFSINPNKVRPDLKEKVIRYQEECFEVLYRYWNEGAVSQQQINSPYDAVDTGKLNSLRQINVQFAIDYLNSLGIDTPETVTGNWQALTTPELYEGLKAFAKEYDEKHFFVRTSEFNEVTKRKRKATLDWLEAQGYLNVGEPRKGYQHYRRSRKCNVYVANNYFKGKKARVYVIEWRFLRDAEKQFSLEVQS